MYNFTKFTLIWLHLTSC